MYVCVRERDRERERDSRAIAGMREREREERKSLLKFTQEGSLFYGLPQHSFYDS